MWPPGVVPYRAALAPHSHYWRLAIQMAHDTGSWAGLAERYPAVETTASAVAAHSARHRQTIQIGAVRWRRCVSVCMTPEGLHLVMPSPGALLKVLGLMGKQPIFIPWTEIVGAEPARLFMLPGYRLLVGSPVVATVTVYSELYSAIYPYLPGAQTAS